MKLSKITIIKNRLYIINKKYKMKDWIADILAPMMTQTNNLINFK